MSSLPLVRGKDRVKPTPDGDAVKKAAEVVETTPESITYLFERAEKSGVLTPELQSMFEDMAKVAENMRDFFAGGDIMGGTEPPTPFIALQTAYNEKAAEALQTQIQDQRVDTTYSIKEDGTMLRGYAVNGKQLDDKNEKEHKVMDNLDTMLKAWMAQQGIFYLEGKLYAANAKGEIQKDNKGNKIHLDARQFDGLVRDPKNGFAAFMKQNGFNNVNVGALSTTKRMAQPSEGKLSQKAAQTGTTTDAQKQRATEQAIKTGHKGEIADAEGVDVHPEESVKQSKR